MIETIPDDIMRTARDVLEQPSMRPFRSDDAAIEIARAIAAERERAAKIAEDMPSYKFASADPTYSLRLPSTIAAAIRGTNA